MLPRWTSVPVLIGLAAALACGGSNMTSNNPGCPVPSHPATPGIRAGAATACTDSLLITGAELDPFTRQVTLLGAFPTASNGSDLVIHLGNAALPTSYVPGRLTGVIGTRLPTGDLWVTSTASFTTSNRVQLTRWTGPPVWAVKQTITYTVVPPSTSNLQTDAYWHLSLVGIINSDLSPQPVAVWSDTYVDYSASGTQSDPGLRTRTWSVGGTGVIGFDSVGVPVYTNGYAGYDGVTHHITAYLTAFDMGGILETTVASNGAVSNMNIPFLSGTPALDMTLDSLFMIASDTVTTGTSTPHTAIWQDLVVQNPPVN